MVRFSSENKYKKRYCKEMTAFFRKNKPYVVHTTKSETPKVVSCELPTFEAYAGEIGVNVTLFDEWIEDHSDFAYAYEICKQVQKDFFIQNALNGCYNAAFAKLFAFNCLGWKDDKKLEGSDDTDELGGGSSESSGKSDLQKIIEYFDE